MNILFITSDQWRAECLSILDHPVVQTPNIDSLAREGVHFTKHYAQATPCSPSRTSMHTGTYMHRNRVCVNGTPYDHRFTNWALELRKKSYAPYLVGYTDTPPNSLALDPSDSRLQHYTEPLPGMDTDSVYREDVPMDWVDYLKSKGYPIPGILWDTYGMEKPGIQWEDGGDAPLPLTISAEDHETYYMTSQCIDWIDRQSSPWVVHVSLLRPHPPFVAPEPYNRFCNPEDLPEPQRSDSPDTEGQQHPWLAYQLSRKKYRAPENLKTLQRFRASYYGLMKEVDDNLGRLFERIKALGQWDDTFVIFTSDHGEQMGDHWLMSKSGYFDASYHIPLIIKDPRSSADSTRGSQVMQFTENVDIMPTLLDSIGADIPSQCDGRSLSPFVQGEPTGKNWRNQVHWEFDFRDPVEQSAEKSLGLTQHQCSMSIIRDDHYKYVHFTALPPLFFDLSKDPNEFQNQADNPEYRELVLEYAQKMISWRMNHNDRSLTETYLSPKGPVTRPSPLEPV